GAGARRRPARVSGRDALGACGGSGAGPPPASEAQVVGGLCHRHRPLPLRRVGAGAGRELCPAPRGGRRLNPVWGPRYIAYDRERLRRNDASVFQIWLSPTGGGRARRLTDVRVPSLVSGLVPLAFSGSGSRLLAEYEGQDTSEAWTVGVASGRTHHITVRGQPVQGAGLSRDGATLLIDEKGFESPPSDGRVATVPFAGGRPRVLVAHGSQASWNR